MTVISRIKIKMRDHHTGIDACIRAPGTDDVNILAQQCRQSTLYRLLDTRGIRLYLPSMIRGTVIGKCYKKPQNTLLAYDFTAIPYLDSL